MNVRVPVWRCAPCVVLGVSLLGVSAASAQPIARPPLPALPPTPSAGDNANTNPGVLITAIAGDQATLNAGLQDGVTVGALYTLTRAGRTVAQLRIVSVSPGSSTARIEVVPDPGAADDVLPVAAVVGDTVQLSKVSPQTDVPSLPNTVPADLSPLKVSPPVPLSSVPPRGRVEPPVVPLSSGTTATSKAPLALSPTLSAPAQPPSPLRQERPVSVQTAPHGAGVPSPPINAPIGAANNANAGFAPVDAPSSSANSNAQFKATSATVLAVLPEGEVTLGAGRNQGVRSGDFLPVVREGQSLGQVRVREVEEEQSTGVFEPAQAGTVLTVGDSVLLESSGRASSPQRLARNGDYLAMLGATLLVLSAQRNPSQDVDKQVIATQQFSAISPFPGGGYSVLPTGEIAPGGALHINMPIAYVPHELSGVVGVYAAQNRRGDSLTSSDGRNGTLNTGLGFGVRGRGVWLSRMGLSTISLSGGDSVYNLAVEVAPETSRFPALAVGAQDVTNRRQRAPFVVATKALGIGSHPLYATVGLGRGRFSTIFGGLSYSPLRRLALTAEYDGLQINLGAGVSITRRFTLLVSANDLSSSDHRPIGELGRRYQVGGTLTF